MNTFIHYTVFLALAATSTITADSTINTIYEAGKQTTNNLLGFLNLSDKNQEQAISLRDAQFISPPFLETSETLHKDSSAPTAYQKTFNGVSGAKRDSLIEPPPFTCGARTKKDTLLKHPYRS